MGILEQKTLFEAAFRVVKKASVQKVLLPLQSIIQSADIGLIG